jgi:hypothetical protein
MPGVNLDDLAPDEVRLSGRPHPPSEKAVCHVRGKILQGTPAILRRARFKFTITFSLQTPTRTT